MRKIQIEGLDGLAKSMGLPPERKEDLRQIIVDRLFRGFDTRETLKRSIERKMKRKLKMP